MSSETISNERRCSIATSASTDTSDSKASPSISSKTKKEPSRRSLLPRIPSVKKLLGLESSDSKSHKEKEKTMGDKDKSPATVTDESLLHQQSNRSSSPKSRKSSKRRSGSVDMDTDSTRGSTHSSGRGSLHGSTHSSRSDNTKNSSDLWSPRSTSSSKTKKKSKKKYDISLQVVNLNDLPEESEEDEQEESKKKNSSKGSRSKSPKKKSTKKGTSSESMEIPDKKSQHSSSDKKRKQKAKKRSQKDKDRPESDQQQPTISKREKLIRLKSESSILTSTEYGYEDMEIPEGPQESFPKVNRRWSGDPTMIMRGLQESEPKKKRNGLVRQLSAKARLADSSNKQNPKTRLTTVAYSQRSISQRNICLDFDSQEIAPSAKTADDDVDKQHSTETTARSSKSKKSGKSSKKKSSHLNSGKGASLEQQISETSESTSNNQSSTTKLEKKLTRRHSAKGNLQSQMDDLLSSPQRERKTFSNQRGRSRSSSVDLTLEEIMSSKSSSSSMRKPANKRRSKSWDRLMDTNFMSGIRQSFSGDTPAVTVLPEPDFPGQAPVVDPILD